MERRTKHGIGPRQHPTDFIEPEFVAPDVTNNYPTILNSKARPEKKCRVAKCIEDCKQGYRRSGNRYVNCCESSDETYEP